MRQREKVARAERIRRQVGWLMTSEAGVQKRVANRRTAIAEQTGEIPPLPPLRPGTHRASNGVTLADRA